MCTGLLYTVYWIGTLVEITTANRTYGHQAKASVCSNLYLDHYMTKKIEVYENIISRNENKYGWPLDKDNQFTLLAQIV